jgi:hypothetical protein
MLVRHHRQLFPRGVCPTESTFEWSARTAAAHPLPRVLKETRLRALKASAFGSLPLGNLYSIAKKPK